MPPSEKKVYHKQSNTYSPALGKTSKKPHHNPPLMSELPKVKCIKEKPITFFHDTTSTIGSLESSLMKTSLEEIRPPQLSPVSKLLAAFSTWMSIPVQDSSSQEALRQQENEGQKSEEEDHKLGVGEDLSDQDGKSNKDASVVLLPPVDSVNIRQVQRKLFMSQMKKHLSTACSKLGLTFHTILPKVTETVAKFR